MADGGTIECSIKIARNISVSEFSTARANKDGVLRLLLIVQMKSPIILIYSHPFFPRRRFPVIVLLPLLPQDTVRRGPYHLDSWFTVRKKEKKI